MMKKYYLDYVIKIISRALRKSVTRLLLELGKQFSSHLGIYGTLIFFCINLVLIDFLKYIYISMSIKKTFFTEAR